MTHCALGLSLVFLLLSNVQVIVPKNQSLAATLTEKLSLRKRIGSPISLKELSKTPYYKKIIPAYTTTYNSRTVDFPEQFVIRLPRGQLMSNLGGVLTTNNRPFFDYVHEINTDLPNFPDWKVDSIKQTIKSKYPYHPTLFSGTVALLASRGEDIYYHWMLEVLPRLKLIAMSGISCDKVYVGQNNRKYKEETLTRCGFSSDHIIYAQQNTLLKADCVIIPSMPHLIANTCPTWAYDYVRTLFLKDTATEAAVPYRKLYITRAKPTANRNQRRIVNEYAVFSYLAKLGFEKVTLEELSVKQQAKLFNSAQTIVAAHGASLTNLVFCNSQHPVTVIEIYQPQWLVNCYSWLTTTLNHDRGFSFKHISLMTSIEKLSEADKAVGNIYVELDDLQKALSPESQPALSNDSKGELEHFGLIDINQATGIDCRSLTQSLSLPPSIPTIYDFTGTLETYELLRSALLHTTPPENAPLSKKLYIARTRASDGSSGRSKELTEYLESKGFLTVVLEELTIQEQAQLFNAAEVIVAAEGASLTNLIFCRSEKPVTIIEIADPAWVNQYYRRLTEQLNTTRGFKFRHTYCIASPESVLQTECDMLSITTQLERLEKMLKTTA